jgi:hypothetical protein
MREEQAKLDRFDRVLTEEDRALGEPLYMPPDITVEGRGSTAKRRILEKVQPLPDFFLRPPKGVNQRPGPRGGSPPHALYPYSGNSVVVYLGGVTDHAKSSDEFRKEVCATLGISAKAPVENVNQDVLGTEPVTWRSKPLEFAKMTANRSGSLFYLYFTERDTDQFVVVFQVSANRTRDENLQKTIAASLGTLEIGGLALKVTQAYQSKDFRTYFQLRMSKEPSKRFRR